MKKLNFPVYSFRFKNSENKVAIFDEIRKKYGSQAIQKEGMKKIQGIGEYISPAKKKKFYLSLKKALKALDNRKDQKIIISGIINKIH